MRESVLAAVPVVARWFRRERERERERERRVSFQVISQEYYLGQRRVLQFIATIHPSGKVRPHTLTA
jgi:hypothetical protein